MFKNLFSAVCCLIAGSGMFWLAWQEGGYLPATLLCGGLAIAGLLYLMAALLSRAEFMWQGAWLRRGWLEYAKSVARLRKWSEKPLVSALLYLALASAVVIVFAWLAFGHKTTAATFFTEKNYSWLQALALAVLIPFTRRLIKPRRKIRLLEPEDLSGEDALKEDIKGLNHILLAEFSRLTEVLERIQDNPFSLGPAGLDTAATSAPPQIDIGGAPDVLKDISLDAKVSFGLLSIPINSLIKLASGLSSDNSLQLRMYNFEDKLFLKAQLVLDQKSHYFSVSESDMEKETQGTGPLRDKLIPAMIQKIGVQIFTQLQKERLQSETWQAVEAFSQGMKDLSLIKSDKNRGYRIRSAERRLTHAYSLDPRFTRSLFNVGIIYYSEKRYQPASAIFRQVLASEPGHTEARYALAKSEQGLNHLLVARRICDQILSQQPDHILALNLRGVLKGAEVSEARDSFHKATVLAWKKLCQETLLGQDNSSFRYMAGLCSSNLAVSLAYNTGPKALREIRQAVYLQPQNESFRFEKAKIALKKEKNTEAVRAFQELVDFKESPHNMLWLACVKQFAEVSGQKGDPYLWKSITADIFDPIFNQETNTLTVFQKVWKDITNIDLPENDKEIQKLQKIASVITDFPVPTTKLSPEKEAQLNTLIKELESGWERGYYHYILAQHYLSPETAHTEAKQHFETCIEDLKKDHSPTIQSLQVYLYLAYISDLEIKQTPAKELEYRKQNRVYIEKGLIYQPGDPYLRRSLSTALLRDGDWEATEHEAEMARSLSSQSTEDKEQSLYTLLQMHWAKYGETLDKKQRQQTAQKLVRIFEDSITQKKWAYIPMNLTSDTGENQENVRKLWLTQGFNYYWLGRFKGELREFHAAIDHLRTAIKLGFKPVESRVAIIWLLLKMQYLGQAEAYFQELIGLSFTDDLFEPGEDRAYGQWKTWASLYSAHALALSGIEEQLDTALQRVEAEKGLIAALPAEEGGDIEYDTVRGLICLKRAENTFLDSEKISHLKESQAFLLKAVNGKSPDSTVSAWYYLSQSFALQATVTAPEKAYWQSRADWAMAQCRKNDLREQWTGNS